MVRTAPAALDPGSVAISIDAMLLRFHARDFEATIRAGRHVQELWPDSKLSHQYRVLFHNGRDDIALAAAEAGAVLAGSDRRLGNSEVLEAYWMKNLGPLMHHVQQNDADPSFLSIHYIQRGQREAAIDALESAVTDNRFSFLLPYIGVSPAFERLCGYPRFEQILRNLGSRH